MQAPCHFYVLVFQKNRGSVDKYIHDELKKPYCLCRIHKPGVHHGPASQQKLNPADDVANDAQLLGRPKYLTTGHKGDPVSNRKAWPRRNDARFRLRPASPTGRPGQRGTTLASDYNPLLRSDGLANAASDSVPLLRSGMHRTSTYSSSPTGAVGAD